MNDNKSLLIISGVFVTMMGCVTLLIINDKPVDQLISFLIAAIVPTIAALAVGKKADAAKEAAEQAVKNTNGNMGQLIAAQLVAGKKPDAKYQKFVDDLLPIISDFYNRQNGEK